MTREDIIRMAREAGIRDCTCNGEFGCLERFAALVAAAEREACAKRRGVLAFCPYTGRPRHPSDIASDPHGILILVPDQPLRGIKP
jgi:hypothetical protein